VLHLWDTSRTASAADSEILELSNGKNVLHVLNKIDLPQRLRLPTGIAHQDVLRVSATTCAGLDSLRDRLVTEAYSGKVGTTDVDIAINERQSNSLATANKYLTETIYSLRKSEPLEIVSQSLRRSLDAIGEVIGKTTTEDILDKIFSTFCIGK
jgi:tRNA modification GTPase